MKNIFYIIIGLIVSLNYSFADSDGGILGDFAGSREAGVNSDTQKALREGDIHLSDIPVMMKGAIDFLMIIAGTISIIFIITGAYKILFGSLQQDTTKGKDTIISAIIGFVIAALAWFIIKLVIDNLS